MRAWRRTLCSLAHHGRICKGTIPVDKERCVASQWRETCVVAGFGGYVERILPYLRIMEAYLVMLKSGLTTVDGILRHQNPVDLLSAIQLLSRNYALGTSLELLSGDVPKPDNKSLSCRPSLQTTINLLENIYKCRTIAVPCGIMPVPYFVIHHWIRA